MMLSLKKEDISFKRLERNKEFKRFKKKKNGC